MTILTWRHPILFIGGPLVASKYHTTALLTDRKYDILAALPIWRLAISTSYNVSMGTRSSLFTITPSTHSPALLDSHSPHSSLHTHLQLERTPRRSSVGQYDTFFGLDDVVASFSDYLVDVFGCPSKLESPGTLKTEPRLQHFIAEVVYSADLPISVASAALILLKRLRAHIPKLTKPSGLSGHRLFLAAFIIAAREQSLCYGDSQKGDKIFSASYWSKISMFSTREIDELTSQFFDRLEGNVTVFPSRAVTLEQTGRPFVIKSYWSVAHSASGGNVQDKLRGSMLSGGPPKRNRSIKAVITSFFLSRCSS
ncbi:hypothetical protein K443DRAFT_339408 [Laccaria amethystina LaAM-08-1]|uniref:Cyclin N-terminal domain-containing protein n=1 Tax=Laccaria amethystina LaAM-08-1 TaxID=1095629 RepID=A0A0C9WJP8_9AGAR|nr:hypothetical protein K443DRAFT_339408 [Laccaria amethystina LaAM-08-1]